MRIHRALRLLVPVLATIALAACGGDDDKTTSPTTHRRNDGACHVIRRSHRQPRAPTGSPASTGEPVADGYAAEAALEQLDFGLATGLYPIPGDDGFAYLVTKDGKVRRVSMTDGGKTHDVVLDLTFRLIANQRNEEGLLGLAFAPDFETSRRIYLNFTTGPPRQDTVSRFVMAETGVTNVASEETLLQIDDPFSNHNGGGMQFGPDGMLYIGFGDGGSGGDPQGQRAEHRRAARQAAAHRRLRRLARTPSRRTTRSRMAADAAEIWAYGFRNPWRFDFDDADGRLWLADVGQGDWEEVDLITKGGNYGWNIMEGPVCYKANTLQSGRADPAARVVLARRRQLLGDRRLRLSRRGDARTPRLVRVRRLLFEEGLGREHR